MQSTGSHPQVVVVHVDDCIIAASTLSLIVTFKCRISQHVEITDLGELLWLLGIKIKCDREQCIIHLSQCTYLNSIIARYNFQDLKPVSTPMETNTQLSTPSSSHNTQNCKDAQHPIFGSSWLSYVCIPQHLP